MTLDPIAISDFLQKAGVVGLLVFILVGGARKTWVWGYQLSDMTSDRDRWRDLALRLLGQVDRTAGVADRITELAASAAEANPRARTRKAGE